MSLELDSRDHLVCPDDTYKENGDKGCGLSREGDSDSEVPHQRAWLCLAGCSDLLLSSEVRPLVLIMMLEFVAGLFL